MLLTIEQLKQKLGVKESWIRSMVFKREIPCVRLGRLIRFNETEIQKWIDKKSLSSLSGKTENQILGKKKNENV